MLVTRHGPNATLFFLSAGCPVTPYSHFSWYSTVQYVTSGTVRTCTEQNNWIDYYCCTRIIYLNSSQFSCVCTCKISSFMSLVIYSSCSDS